MYNSCNSIVQTYFMNSLYNSNSVTGSKIAYFGVKYIVLILLQQHFLELCQVFVLLCLLKTKS